MKIILYVPLMVLPMLLAATVPQWKNFIVLVAIVCFIAEMFKAASQENMNPMVTDFVLSFMLVIIGFVVTTHALERGWSFTQGFGWFIAMTLATADVLVGTIIKFFRLRRDFGSLDGNGLAT